MRPIVRGLSLAALLAFSLASYDALAGETVRLRDGSTFQGELVEKVPGDRVTIRLATGEIKRFAWGDIVPEAAPAATAPAAPKSKLQEMLPLLLVVNIFLLIVLIVVVIFALKSR